MREYYSNCLIEYIKAKLKYRSRIKTIYISPRFNDGFDFVPHWLWYNKDTNKIYDFHTDFRLKHIWNVFWFKGYIRELDLKKFNRWYFLATKEYWAPM